VTKSQSAAKDDEDSVTTQTEEYYGTLKLTETRPRQLSSRDHTQARSDITYAYYPFLCIGNLSSLHPDDVNYLESQGCFKVPESNSLDELLRVFFRYAHPILPVVNEAEFWSAYDSTNTDGKTNRVPVVLIVAMLFVACNVSPETRCYESLSLTWPRSMLMTMLSKVWILLPHVRQGINFTAKLK
jgi:hypothetical protein